MRRKRMTAFQPVSRRSGVIASVMQRNRSVQVPVSLVRSLSGLALRLFVTAAQINHGRGPSAARKTAGLRTHRMVRSLKPAALIVFTKIEPGVERRDLIAVAVEHQRLAPQ